MAGIINGVWHEDHAVNPQEADLINNWITLDGSAGLTGHSGFKAEKGRYLLYLAHGCPLCHSVAIAREYFCLKQVFDVAYVDDVKRHDGWTLSPGADPVFAASSLHEMMIAAEGNLTAKSTVPQLLDKKSKRLVSDSSSDMVRMMDQISTFSDPNTKTLWPCGKETEIDRHSKRILTEVSGGAYRTLFSKSRGERQENSDAVRESLSKMNSVLSNRKYLMNNDITAADVWFFPTLLRLDHVYSELFGINFKLSAFPSLVNYLSRLWAIDVFANTTDLERIKKHYFNSLIHGAHGFVEPGASFLDAGRQC